METVKIVKIYPTEYWVEQDMMGSSHIMIQHEGIEPFTYATFNYNYAYTSNSGIRTAVVKMMESFGIKEEDIVWKQRDLNLEILDSEKMVVGECASVIQDFVDQRIPASEYPSMLKSHFGVE